MVEDDIAMQIFFICSKAFFEDHGIKVDRTELLILSTLNESYNLTTFQIVFFFLPNRDSIRMHFIRTHLHAH